MSVPSENTGQQHPLVQVTFRIDSIADSETLLLGKPFPRDQHLLQQTFTTLNLLANIK